MHCDLALHSIQGWFHNLTQHQVKSTISSFMLTNYWVLFHWVILVPISYFSRISNAKKIVSCLLYYSKHDFLALGHSPSWRLLYNLTSYGKSSKSDDSFQFYLLFILLDRVTWINSVLDVFCFVLIFFSLPVMCQTCIVTLAELFLTELCIMTPIPLPDSR